VAGTVRPRPSAGRAERPRAWCGRFSRVDGHPARTRVRRLRHRPGRAADRQKALDFGAQEFVDLDNDPLEDAAGVDLVFDVIGGDIQKRSATLIIGNVATLDDAVAAFNPTERISGQTVIRVRPS
jgi:hypothetical protein